MFWNKYPYTNFHELNLDWIIQMIKSLDQSMDDFQAINQITFEGEWDITKQYKPWAIVNDNNAGYISIQPVPAGVTISNTDYWRSIVDYTATIADLQNRVITLEGQMDTVIPAIEELQTLLPRSRYFLFIGDSYLESPSASANWGAYAAQNLGLSADQYELHAFSGTGFAVSGNNTILPYIQNIVVDDPDKVTDIVMCLGANDLTNYSTAQTANIGTTIDYLKATYQNANIHMGMIGNAVIGGPYSNTASNLTIRNTAYLYMNGAEIKGAHYLNGVETILHNYSRLGADGLHPNGSGAVALGNGIANAIKGGSGQQDSGGSMLTVTPVIGTIGDSADPTDICAVYQTDGHIYVDGKREILWKLGGASMAWNQAYKIGTFTGGVIFANAKFEIMTTLTALTDIDPGKYVNVPAKLTFERGNLYLTPYYQHSGVFETHTYQNTYIPLPNFSIPLIQN